MTRPSPAVSETTAVSPGEAARTMPVTSLAWLAATAAFLGLRLGLTWQAPVGGAELVHLSGAWQAAIGIDDARFVPTLFQALTALSLEFTTSEVPARIIAFAATATLPAALCLLRRALGEAGALFALGLLAVDPAGIWWGVAATASGFDVGLALWLLVLIDRRPGLPAAWAAAGFLAVSAGPLPLVLALAALGVQLVRGRPFSPGIATPVALGAAAAILAASLGFGFGPVAVVVPPFDVFAASFDQEWSTATALEAATLYGWPLLILGIAGAALLVHEREHGLSTTRLVILSWFGLGLAWLVAAGGSHATLALAAATMPAALLGGQALAGAASLALGATWGHARILLPAAALALLVAATIVARWARAGEVEGAGEALVVVLLVAGATGALVALAAQAGSRRSLPLAAAAVLLLPLIAGAFGVGLSGISEPLPSPVVSPQARVLRSVALQLASDRGGDVAIHPDLLDDATWSLRDSGTVVVSDRIPTGAAVVLWPASLPQPSGVVALTGEWALLRVIEPPLDDWLTYVNWFADRNAVVTRNEPIAVYTVATE